MLKYLLKSWNTYKFIDIPSYKAAIMTLEVGGGKEIDMIDDRKPLTYVASQRIEMQSAPVSLIQHIEIGCPL